MHYSDTCLKLYLVCRIYLHKKQGDYSPITASASTIGWPVDPIHPEMVSPDQRRNDRFPIPVVTVNLLRAYRLVKRDNPAQQARSCLGVRFLEQCFLLTCLYFVVSFCLA